MDIKISPSFLSGKITVPPSKSISHRALICAALADGKSILHNVLDCEDTKATTDALTALGAKITANGEDTLVEGIGKPAAKADINCRESGSTLRFMIPIAAALGTETTFTGQANLPNRPITPFLEEFPKHGVDFDTQKMPYTIRGRLSGGEFPVTGDISSQFITGYMLALPLTGTDCTIKLTSELQSRPYAELTADVMETFGVHVAIGDRDFRIASGSSFKPREYTVEAGILPCRERCRRQNGACQSQSAQRPGRPRDNRYYQRICRKRGQSVRRKRGKYPRSCADNDGTGMLCGGNLAHHRLRQAPDKGM